MASPSPLSSVVQQLGGKTTLGAGIESEAGVRKAIRKGFPPAAIDALMRASDLSLAEMSHALALSPRSLQRRRHSGRLAPHESDRLYRLARVVAAAIQFLGSRDRAWRWLKRPNASLGGVSPYAILDTELGAQQVESVLGRIGFGGIG